MDEKKAPRGRAPSSDPLQGEAPTTQTIDVDELLGNHLTDSGSVDLRGVASVSFQKLLDAIPIPVLVLDEHLLVTVVNTACAKICPVPKECLGTHVQTFFPESTAWKDVEAVLVEVFATRTPRIWQSPLGIGNRIIWGRMHVRSIRGIDGRSLLVLIEDLTLERQRLIQDRQHKEDLQEANRQLTSEIGRRKRVEEALRESESSFRILVESAPFGLSVMSPDGSFTFFNQKFTEIFGYTLDDLPDKDSWFFRAYPDEEYRGSVFSVWQGDTSEQATAGEVKPRVFTVRCKDGSDKIINFRAVNLDDRRQILTYEDISLQAKTARALRESEAKYRTLFEAAAEAIFLMRGDRFIECNTRTLEIYGCTRDQIIGQTPDRFSPERQPDGRLSKDKALEFINAALDGKPQAFEWLHIRDDGSLFDAEVTLSRLDLTGEKLVLAIVRDVTRRKKAEEALRESEERYRRLVAALPDGIGVHIRGKLVFINPAGVQLFGASSDKELMGKSVLEMVHPDYRERSRLRLETVARKGTQAPLGEVKLLRVDGQAFDGELTTLPFIYHGSSALLTVGRDVSERKRAVEELRESEQRYRQLVEKANDIIFVCDSAGCLSLVNPVAVTITGYSQQELIGKHYLDLVHPEHRKEAARVYGRQFVKRIPDTYHELPILTREAKVVWLGQHVQLLIQGDAVLGFQAICRDITERKRTEDLQVQAARLKAVGDLASGVAHNFNNLLQIVMGAAQLGSANLDLGKTSNVKKQLQDIVESCRFGAETVKRLQSFANIRSDEAPSGKQVFDLSALVRQAVEMTKPWWKTAPEREGFKVNLNLDLADGCFGSGRPNELFEVVVNLIKNAAEALQQDGDIDVATFVKSGQVVLRVRDTGVGLDQESAARVFDPFWTTKKGLDGTGMGLAASYGIINRHGGTISVESIKGQGSVFTVMVPLASGSPEAAAPFPAASDRGLHILVIDDLEATVTVLKEGLEHHLHTVFTALSGREGLEVFKRESIDLVICDLGMPGLNGWQVGRALKGICQDEDRPKIPFILLTGWGDQFEPEKMLESGVDAVLQKPTDFAGLMRVIRELVEKSGERPAQKDSLPDR